MLLGGLHFLIPVIEKAHELGLYVITCDYLPQNPAHHYSDEYVNASIMDRDAVLAAARRLQIDGIMSYAVDPGVVTAAYVQQEMGLPAVGPLASVETLQHKDLFRQFLSTHGFNCPKSRGYNDLDKARRDLRQEWQMPVIIKPVDSAGSKGVTRVNDLSQAEDALRYAHDCSHCGRIIIEEFLDIRTQSSSDIVVQDGRVVHATYSTEYYEEATQSQTPFAAVFPSDMTTAETEELTSELQRLVDLLGIRSTVMNIDACATHDGRTYIIEASPRGGGNRLGEVGGLATGLNALDVAIRLAMGMETGPIEQQPYNGHWALAILHSRQTGQLRKVNVLPPFDQRIVMTHCWVKPGDYITSYKAADTAIGLMFLHFKDQTERELYCRSAMETIQIIVEPDTTNNQ